MHWPSHIEINVGLMTTKDVFFWQKANHRIHKDQHVLQTKGNYQPDSCLQPDTGGDTHEILQPVCSCQFKRQVETLDGIHYSATKTGRGLQNMTYKKRSES